MTSLIHFQCFKCFTDIDLVLKPFTCIYYKTKIKRYFCDITLQSVSKTLINKNMIKIDLIYF